MSACNYILSLPHFGWPGARVELSSLLGCGSRGRVNRFQFFWSRLAAPNWRRVEYTALRSVYTSLHLHSWCHICSCTHVGEKRTGRCYDITSPNLSDDGTKTQERLTPHRECTMNPRDRQRSDLAMGSARDFNPEIASVLGSSSSFHSGSFGDSNEWVTEILTHFSRVIPITK